MNSKLDLRSSPRLHSARDMFRNVLLFTLSIYHTIHLTINKLKSKRRVQILSKPCVPSTICPSSPLPIPTNIAKEEENRINANPANHACAYANTLPYPTIPSTSTHLRNTLHTAHHTVYQSPPKPSVFLPSRLGSVEVLRRVLGQSTLG
jgi:hypothetical protein